MCGNRPLRPETRNAFTQTGSIPIPKYVVDERNNL